MSVAAGSTTSGDSALLEQLTLIGHDRAADLTSATSSAVVTRDMDGAPTLALTVPDHRRVLLRSGILDDYLWAVVDGLHYCMVSVAKSTDVLTVTMEDAVTHALRQQKGTRKWAAGTASRARMVRDMAAEVPVSCDVDPSDTALVTAETNRSKAGETPTSSWDLMGTLASDVTLRRFSDGRQLVFGADAWLATRYPAVTLTEPVLGALGALNAQGNPVSNIDFTNDYGQASNSATLTVDADRWATPIGQGAGLVGMGPADGTWLVSKTTRTLTRNRMTVTLNRIAAQLPEPSDADTGELTFLPGETALPDDGSASAASLDDVSVPAALKKGSTLAQFVALAKQQSGAKYIWGNSGPKAKGFDCSGLIQYCTTHVGDPVGKPARSQWAAVKKRGHTMSVAQALQTPGALLFRIKNVGGKPEDHVVISLGDGTTMEARGKAYGVGVFPNAAKREWTNAGYWITPSA